MCWIKVYIITQNLLLPDKKMPPNPICVDCVCSSELLLFNFFFCGHYYKCHNVTSTQCRSTPVTLAVIVCIFIVFQPVPAVLWEHFLEEIHATVKQEVVSVNVWWLEETVISVWWEIWHITVVTKDCQWHQSRGLTNQWVYSFEYLSGLTGIRQKSSNKVLIKNCVCVSVCPSTWQCCWSNV